ncbi:MAG: enolase C-terminal domain-like protein [Prosthecobacter sp.]
MHAEIKTFELAEAFRIAHGASTSRQVLRLSEAGHTVEAPFVPYYSDDPQATLEALSVEPLRDPLPRTATLALDLLRLETAAQSAGRKLSELAEPRLADATRRSDPIPGCRSLGIPDDLDAFAEKVASIARQFKAIKLKLGSGDLGLDMATVSVARNAAPDADLILDVNGGWDLSEAGLMITQLSNYSPVLIEQPIHHRHGPDVWEELRASLPGGAPPIFADETVQNETDLAIFAPLIDGVNIKLLKCGGFDAGVSMIAAARKQNLQILLGCMIESSLGTTATAHLASWADWIDLDGHLYLADDDYCGITYDAEGHLVMPDRPGIGAVKI